MIGATTVLAQVQFTEELQKILNIGHGNIEIAINESCIVFSFTVPEINPSEERYKREKQRLLEAGYGKIEITRVGNHLKYEFTHMKKVKQ